MKRLTASLLSVAAEDITTFGLIFGLLGTVIFGGIILFRAKETFSRIPELIRKNRQKKQEAREKQAEQNRKVQDMESEYRQQTSSRKPTLLDYVDIISWEVLPDDADFVKQLMLEFERIGDERRAYLCRKKLALHLRRKDIYAAYARDLLNGTVCPKDVDAALEILDPPRDGESFYLLYQIGRSPNQYQTPAYHLSMAYMVEYPEAVREVERLRGQAANGDGYAAYLVYEALHRSSCASYVYDRPEKGKELMYSESLFWLMLASALEYPDAQTLYERRLEDAQWFMELPVCLDLAYTAMKNKDMEYAVYMSMQAAIRDHSGALFILGVALYKGLGVAENRALGKLCIDLAKKKAEQE